MVEHILSRPILRLMIYNYIIALMTQPGLFDFNISGTAVIFDGGLCHSIRGLMNHGDTKHEQELIENAFASAL